MNIKIAFETTNTIGYILSEEYTANKYEHTGIYKLTCLECQKSYLGEIWRSLRTRYKEHIQSIKFNKKELGYTTYILRNLHCYGKMKEIKVKIDHVL
jgi:hypothetical protein